MAELVRDISQKKNKGGSLDDEQKSALSIHGTYLMKNNEIYIPAPLDLFEDGEGRVYQGTYKKDRLYAPEYRDKKMAPGRGKFLSLKEFMYYYGEMRTRGLHLKDEGYFFGRYDKTGIEIDSRTKAAKEEHLYYSQMLEPKFGSAYLIMAEVKEESLDEGWRRDVLLGGRNRVAHLESVSGYGRSLAEWKEYRDQRLETETVRLVFTSPCLVGNLEKLKQLWKNGGIEVKSMVTGRPETIGGYDMASERRKPLQTALPAGSVFLLKSDRFKDKTNWEIRDALLEKGFERECEQLFRGFGNFVIADGGDGIWE